MIDLNSIGGIVASETGGLTTWQGDTQRYWAKFDIDPKTVGVLRLRKHLVDAVEYDEDNRPEGYIWVIAFTVSEGREQDG